MTDIPPADLVRVMAEALSLDYQDQIVARGVPDALTAAGFSVVRTEEVERLEKARKLCAIAINQLHGPTIFDGEVTASDLRRVAIKHGLFQFDELHHAPACPANHYHEQRFPTGSCTCGAARAALANGGDDVG